MFGYIRDSTTGGSLDHSLPVSVNTARKYLAYSKESRHNHYCKCAGTYVGGGGALDFLSRHMCIWWRPVKNCQVAKNGS